MKPQQTVIIAGAMVVIVAIAALMRSNTPTSGGSDLPETLVPELSEALPSVRTIELTNAEGSISITSTDTGWVLPANDNYPASTEAVVTLVNGLENLTIAERKTANADNHARLGLALPENADDASPTARIRLLAEDGSPVADVVLGNRDANGVFVRNADEAQTWLADSAPTVSTEASAWFDTQPVQVERDEVRTVTITHADGEVVRITKVEDSFVLAELPDGTEPIGPWQAGQVAGALGFLNVESVRSAASLGFADTARSAVLFELEPTKVAEDGEPAADAAPPTLVIEVAEIEGSPWATFTAARPGAGEVNATTEGWAYRLTAFTRDALLKRTADLTRAIEADATAGPVVPDVPAPLTPPGDD